MNNGKNIPVHAAIEARAPPKAKAPVSPINIDALQRLCRRKPAQAPAIDAPNMESSVLDIETHTQQESWTFRKCKFQDTASLGN